MWPQFTVYVSRPTLAGLVGL